MNVLSFRGLVVALCLTFISASASAETRDKPLPLKASSLLKHLDRAIAAGDEPRIERVLRVLVVLGPRAKRSLKRELRRDSARLPHLLDALGRMAPEMRLMARPLLSHKSAQVRARAAAAIDGADARVLLAALERETDRDAQYAMIDSLAVAEEKTVTQFLAGQLDSPDPKRRIKGLQGLALRGDRSALADVYAALRDPQPLVRHAGIEAVAALGDNDAVRILLDLVSIETDERNTAAIWRAVRGMTGQDLGEDPKDWLNWLDSGV